MLPNELIIYINTFICKRHFNLEKDLVDVFNIDLIIDYDSFDRYGISKNLYEPYLYEAVDIIESHISRGLPDVAAGDYDGNYGNNVYQHYEDANLYNYEYIDDLAITIMAEEFNDHNTLGGAFFSEIRYETDQNGDVTKIGLPSQGTIKIGSSDFIYEEYDITALAVHEIAHVLGFGTLWYDEVGFLEDVMAPWNQYGDGNIIDENGNYIGNYALEAYSEYIGSPQEFIPIEQDFGEGSAKSHWNYEEFDWEIMSYAQDPDNAGILSKITIESLKDIGYDIIDYGDSNAQFVNYISTAIKQELDFTNEMLIANQSNEDQNIIQRIL